MCRQRYMPGVTCAQITPPSGSYRSHAPASSSAFVRNPSSVPSLLTATSVSWNQRSLPCDIDEWKSVRHSDFHSSMSHGNERWFHDTEVAVKSDGTLLGFRTKALDDAGAWLRYEPLGGVIWAQVTPGMYKWRHIRLEFTQVATNKAPCSPNRGYSRMQHLWFTERVIDIVAHELGLDPIDVRKRNYIKAEDMPYETPNGCVYDSGDYDKMLDVALELIGWDAVETRKKDAEARGKLLGVGIGSTLDSGTNNFGQSRMINPEL